MGVYKKAAASRKEMATILRMPLCKSKANPFKFGPGTSLVGWRMEETQQTQANAKQLERTKGATWLLVQECQNERAIISPAYATASCTRLSGTTTSTHITLFLPFKRSYGLLLLKREKQHADKLLFGESWRVWLTFWRTDGQTGLKRPGVTKKSRFWRFAIWISDMFMLQLSPQII